MSVSKKCIWDGHKQNEVLSLRALTLPALPEQGRLAQPLLKEKKKKIWPPRGQQKEAAAVGFFFNHATQCLKTQSTNL